MSIKKFNRVLVANRGEIAIRIFRALSELDIRTVGIFSKEDKYSLFRSKADESYMLDPEKGPVEAYLDIDNIIRMAKEKQVDAIHPGYGFLSENAEFVTACNDAGIVFIGPERTTMGMIGDKILVLQYDGEDELKAALKILNGRGRIVFLSHVPNKKAALRQMEIINKYYAL